MDKYNIAQIVALKSKTTDHTLIIGNTHLLYNMKRGEIKLGKEFCGLMVDSNRTNYDTHEVHKRSHGIVW